MIKIEASPERVLRLGYAGEDKVTKVIFPYNEAWLDLGEGEFYIRVLRPGDIEPYDAADVTNDSEAMTLTLVVTDVELSKEGYGQMQVVYIGAQAVKKSSIYRYRVSKAIDEPVNPPDGSIINEVVRSLAELTDEVGDISTALEGKADTQTVSALADAVQDLDGDVQSLQTTVQAKADTATVTALSGTVSGLQTAVQSKANTTTVTALTNRVTAVETDKATHDEVDTVQDNLNLLGQVAQQYMEQTSVTLSGLQTGLAGKIEIPHTDEAKVAIQKMLGIPNFVSEVINEVTVTEDSAKVIINTDVDGNPFILRACRILVKIPQSTTGSTDWVRCDGHIRFINDTSGIRSFPTLKMISKDRSVLAYDYECFPGGLWRVYAVATSAYEATTNPAQSILYDELHKGLKAVHIGQYSNSTTLIPAGTKIKIIGIRL